jgi:hypothetical protein
VAPYRDSDHIYLSSMIFSDKAPLSNFDLKFFGGNFCGILLTEHRNNGTAHFKNANNCLNTNNYSYLETSGGLSSDLHFNSVHFFLHQC